MENVEGEQDLALQQHFSNKTYSFITGGSDSGHFGIFDALFPFLAFFKL